MYIEKIIFIGLFLMVGVMGFTALVGWMRDSDKLKEVYASNNSLLQENSELQKENRKLKAKLSFLRQTDKDRQDEQV